MIENDSEQSNSEEDDGFDTPYSSDENNIDPMRKQKKKRLVYNLVAITII